MTIKMTEFVFDAQYFLEDFPTALKPIKQIFEEQGDVSLKDKTNRLIDVIKHFPIDGCITGSCLLPNFDPDEWCSTPDVDIFVFNELDLVRAICLATSELHMLPGQEERIYQQREEWKLNRLFKTGSNNKYHLDTFKFFVDGVVLNITYKQKKHMGRWIPVCSTTDVLESFDMTIIMQGYDIKRHILYDLRGDDPMTAYPNPLREQDYIMWDVAKWIRQFDRVVKYWSRGYDTRPVAENYIEQIDNCLAQSKLFDSEKSSELYDAYATEFIEKRQIIQEWLNAHKDD